MKPKLYKKELSEGLNLSSEVVDRLFSLFFSSIQIELNNLKSAIESNNLEEVYVISHKISGSASNLRLDEIMNLGKKIEEKAKEKHKEDYYLLYHQLVNAFDQANKDVSEESTEKNNNG